MVAQPSLFHEIIKYVTIATSLGGAVTGVYHFGKRVVDWFMVPRRTILKLATNHLPHLQATLQEHTNTMVAMQSDLRDLDTKVSGYSERLDDTKKAVNSLHDAFIQHLERNVHAV